MGSLFAQEDMPSSMKGANMRDTRVWTLYNIFVKKDDARHKTLMNKCATESDAKAFFADFSSTLFKSVRERSDLDLDFASSMPLIEKVELALRIHAALENWPQAPGQKAEFQSSKRNMRVNYFSDTVKLDTLQRTFEIPIQPYAMVDYSAQGSAKIDSSSSVEVRIEGARISAQEFMNLMKGRSAEISVREGQGSKSEAPQIEIVYKMDVAPFIAHNQKIAANSLPKIEGELVQQAIMLDLSDPKKKQTAQEFMAQLKSAGKSGMKLENSSREQLALVLGPQMIRMTTQGSRSASVPKEHKVIVIRNDGKIVSAQKFSDISASDLKAAAKVYVSGIENLKAYIKFRNQKENKDLNIGMLLEPSSIEELLKSIPSNSCSSRT